MSELALLKQELRDKRRSLLIWIAVWSLLLLLFSSVFNSFSRDAAANAQLFEQLPQGIFQAINIDPAAYLTKIEKFISGQFLFVYLLAGSIFAFTMGVGAIGKRIENRTLASLLTSPISRSKIYAVQALSSIVYFAVAGAALCGMALLLVNTIITTQENISTQYFINLFIGSTLLFIAFSCLGQLLGMIANGEHAVQFGAGIVVVSWFLTSLGEFVHIPAGFQSLSLFHYFDVTTLRDNFVLNGPKTTVLIGVITGFVVLGVRLFRKKDIYL